MKFLMLALSSASLIASAPAFAPRRPRTPPTVLFKTTQGDIKVKLYPEKAPKTVANFLDYVKSGQYSGTISRDSGLHDPGRRLQHELRRKADARADPAREQEWPEERHGQIAMARTSDPNSATAQFFINTVDNAGLDYLNPDGNGYAVFGKVVAGMDVVKKIEGSPTTTRGPMQNVPQKPTVIESASVLPQ